MNRIGGVLKFGCRAVGFVWRMLDRLGWVVAIVFVVVGFAKLHSVSVSQSRDHARNAALICGSRGVNGLITYLRNYENPSPREIRKELTFVNATLPSDSPTRQLLDAFGLAELQYPALVHVHPFQHKPLDCNAIVKRAAGKGSTK